MALSIMIDALVRTYVASEEATSKWRNRDGSLYGCGPAYAARCAAIEETLAAFGYVLVWDGYGLSASFDVAVATARDIPEAMWPESAHV